MLDFVVVTLLVAAAGVLLVFWQTKPREGPDGLAASAIRLLGSVAVGMVALATIAARAMFGPGATPWIALTVVACVVAGVMWASQDHP